MKTDLRSEGERAIINTYDQLKAAGGEQVGIFKHYGGIREHYVAGWAVTRFKNGVALVTAPDPHRGGKVFRMRMPRTGTFHQRMAATLVEAQAWVQAQGWYDGPWARNAVGDFVPADVQRRFPIRRRPKKPPVRNPLGQQ